MKPIKMFGLAALAALMAMALIGASSAMASETSLCLKDETPCPTKQLVTHVHEATLSGNQAVLKTSILTVKCDVLFLSSTSVVGGAPLVAKGNFTYSSCNNSCVVTEENGPTEINVLKTAHETAEVTGKGLVHVVCGAFIDCLYNGTGLKGTAKGPLLSTETNGEVTLTEQNVNEEGGSFLCPDTSKLTITTTPLSATYITSGLHYCVEYSRANTGFYLNSTCTTKDATRAGKFELIVGPAGGTVGQTVCVDLSEKIGLYKNSACTEDQAASLYEKGILKTVQ